MPMTMTRTVDDDDNDDDGANCNDEDNDVDDTDDDNDGDDADDDNDDMDDDDDANVDDDDNDQDERYTDSSGPLHVYVRTSEMPQDLWEFYNITDNYWDPVYGSQSYDINNWYRAPRRDWRWMGIKDYRDHPLFKNWSLDPLWRPPTYAPLEPSAPPDEEENTPMPRPHQPIAAIANGPIDMGSRESDSLCETATERARPTARTLFSCLPFEVNVRKGL